MKLAAFTKSIRWRLLLWFGFLLACILTGFGLTAYQYERIARFRSIDDEFLQRVAAVTADARPNLPAPPAAGKELDPTNPPVDWRITETLRQRTIRLSAATQRMLNAWDTNGFYFAFWSRDGNVLKKSANFPAGISMPAGSGRSTVYRIRSRGNYREAYVFTEMGECALVGRNIADDLRAVKKFAAWLVLVGFGVLAVGLGGSAWLVDRALRPVEKISEAARRISGGKLSERISIAEMDSELGQLANTLNSTFARLEAVFTRQKQFTAVAAHELRTPVSVMLTHTQNGLAGTCANEEHREALEASHRAAQRMRRLIESLLALARLDAGQESMKRVLFDFSRTVRDCVDLVSPVADERDVKIITDCTPVEVVGDPEHIGQVIANLLSNAIQYNKSGGKVYVHLWLENDLAQLTVGDTGAGIPADDLPRVFERFFRAEKSRSSAGLGLGLALSKSIVEAHGGTISVSSKPGAGTVFLVCLPA